MPTSNVRVIALALLITAALLVIASACGGDGAADRTGIQEIDQVLDAVASDDAEQIEALVSVGQRPCVRVDPDIGRPAGVSIIECLEGEPEGTLVSAFWNGSCEGSVWYRAGRNDAAQTASRVVGWDLELYGVFEARPLESVTADYTAVFAHTDDAGAVRGIALPILDGTIIGTDQDCGVPPAEMVELSKLGDPILIVGDEG